MLFEDVDGTGDIVTQGDLLMVDDGTGKLLATTGSPESEAFIAMETIAAPTADILIHCMHTGY